MLKHVHNPKFWLSAIVLVWLTLILVVPNGQPAIAQPKVTELKPPFKFVEADRQPLVAVRPPGSTIIMTETFGSSFDPVTAVTGTVPLWRQVVNPTDTAGYYWDRVSGGTFANTAWSAVVQATPGLPLLTPGTSTYPAGQDTWLLYGPIDLSKYFYATLSFEYYLDATSGDQLIWGITTDGSDVIGYNQLGGNGSAEWTTGMFQFDRAVWGNNTVYIAFGFKSGASPNGKGPFIRNVSLRGEPIYMVYLPLVLNNYPPTPTPTPTNTPIPALYSYTFDPGNTSDLASWGGAYYNSGSTKYGQCIPGQCSIHYTSPHGNPSNSLRLYTNGTYHFVASGPSAATTPNNFDLYVDISPWVIYPRWAGCAPWCPEVDLGDWYGIIFNASNDTFGANPSQFAYNKTYYRLYFYNGDSVKPIKLVLERCDGGASSGSNTCHSLGSSSLPGNFIGSAGGFDTVHIKREGAAIQVRLNDTLLISANDATYTGSSHGKFGVFIFSWTLNATQDPPVGYEMQVDFDNIKVYQP